MLIIRCDSLGLRVAHGPSDEGDVILLGFQDNPFRFQWHAAAFVLPSAWEGFPMVIGEAMACGLPIVSADCPTGPREFLAPGTIESAVRPLRAAERGEFGILMPIPNVAEPGSITAWTDELDRLLGDEPLRRKMSAQSLVRADQLSRDKVGAQWLALIDELLTTRS